MESQDNQVLMPQKKRRIAPIVALLGVAAAGGLGYLSWKQRDRLLLTDAKVGELSTKNQDLANALELHRTGKAESDDKLLTCKDELATEQTSLAQVETRVSATEAELAACQTSVKTLEQQQAEAKKTMKELEELTGKFKSMIDSGKLDVAFRRGKMVVKLPAAILFPSGSADISDEGRVALGEVAVVLKGIKDRRFTIAGHTDAEPLGKDDKFKSNWELSAARAVVVTQILVEKGVPAQNLVAAGYGEHDPVSPNSTKAGKAKNRRIEMILEPYISRELATAEIPK